MSAYVDATGVTNLTADIKELADATYPANISISPNYDASSAYAVDDYCLYRGKLYKCNTAIATGGEAWTVAHWTQVSIVDEMGSSDNYSLKFFNTEVPVSVFETNEGTTIVSDYEDYPCRATISLTGVTSTMIPDVVFALEEAMSGIFSPISETYNGGIYIYSTEVPSDSFTIPTIVCWS